MGNDRSMYNKSFAKKLKILILPTMGTLVMSVAAFLPTFTVSGQSTTDDSHKSAAYLRPALAKDQTISQVFSRTISTTGPGIDPLVKRISGTGTYRVTAVGEHEYSFDAKFLYDGRPASVGAVQIRKDGRESCWENQCSIATDASGLLFNPLLWGAPSGTISLGTKWHTQIALPWELGPQGDEDVTVVSLDPATGTITLLRQGSGDGAFDHDAAQLKVTSKGAEYTVDVKPGHASWSGYTIFSKGIVVSDELLVERTLTLSSKELGNIAASQRQYILLNKMPQASSWN
jgi:hypothetical protein